MKKILLIEDDQDLNEALRKHLEYNGYAVTTAFDGREGVEKLKQYTPDLVITDIVMPTLDGLGFMMSITNDFFFDTESLPFKILAISGGGRLVGKEYLFCARSMGVDAVLEKPFSFTELSIQIQQLLN